MYTPYNELPFTTKYLFVTNFLPQNIYHEIIYQEIFIYLVEILISLFVIWLPFLSVTTYK